MPRKYKRFEEHSADWQRKAKRDGLSSRRWNAFGKLSEKSRKTADIRAYASGKSVKEQHRTAAQKAVISKLANLRTADNVYDANRRAAAISERVAKMTPAQLNKYAKATDAQMRRWAKRSGSKDNPNLGWYG